MPSSSLPDFELAGSIWFKSGTQNWGNPRRMALLAAIREHGSISAAARSIGLSYKAAWDAIDTINNLSDAPLVLRTTGGQRGGGAELTDKAIEILELYEHLDEVHQRFMKRLARARPGSDQTMRVLQNMMVQTSARNNFIGKVQSIAFSEISAEVTLNIGEQFQIISSITRESAETLGLGKGVRALAFIKASSILIGTDLDGITLSARNVLRGKIVQLESEKTGADVGLELPSGHRITATITAKSMELLGLALNQDAYAIFKAPSVLLGTID
ncbi:TOBE domain-containing protein [Paenalcaligenes niemegkensis]|uniref:TOBE domain-containing protein n=1 Tax=Paenalcaligenes niemegkensis TaxID=2895469 RepID=UPI001EE8211B|nr:TOBE domain-containing protein [Paenalcaligenes niemegkensis]MCQ9615824.1 TOBE domain-containing protein [Paenalcaligenes niemegkensis]